MIAPLSLRAAPSGGFTVGPARAVDNSLRSPRSGLHNPLRNVERYNMLGDVMSKGAVELGKPEVQEFFATLIQRLVPKSWAQCVGEPTVTRKWMEKCVRRPS